MFEFNGKEFTLEQVMQSAEQAGLSFEDYIQKHGIVEIQKEEVEVKKEEKTLEPVPAGAFEYNGKPFTFDQVDKSAKNANLSFNEYINKHNIKTTENVDFI